MTSLQKREAIMANQGYTEICLLRDDFPHTADHAVQTVECAATSVAHIATKRENDAAEESGKLGPRSGRTPANFLKGWHHLF
jgi:hypothetical protein